MPKIKLDFRLIPGTNGQYSINDVGYVYSYFSNKIIKPWITNSGYLCVKIFRKSTYVHKLVAQTFIKNTNKETIVNHIDGNKLNNNVENLEWCNKSHDVLHAYKSGLRKQKRKVNDKQVKEIQLMLSRGAKYDDISTMYGISNASVSSINNGNRAKKLTQQIINEIFYSTKRVSDICKQYSISQSTVSRIKNKKRKFYAKNIHSLTK